jgi:ribosomal protein S18 acetylase RimI-like enzyme
MFAVAPPEGFRMLSIAVAESVARKGVGTALVRGFEIEIPPECRTYGLSVLKSNTSAICFYEKLSFQFVGETAIAWKLRKALTANAIRPELRAV